MDYGLSIDIGEINGVAVNMEQGNMEGGVLVKNHSQPVTPEGTNNTGKNCCPKVLFCSNCHYMGHRTWRSVACKKAQQVS